MGRLSQFSYRVATAAALVLAGTVLPGGSVAAQAACFVPERVSDRPVTGSLAPQEAAAAQRDFEARMAAAPKTRQRAAANVTISLNWHVVAKDNTVAGGNLPDAQIALQMQVLNIDYAPTGVQFRLAGVTRTVNPAWYRMSTDSPEETAMKGALRVGGVSALNVYSVGHLTSPRGQSLLGDATFPWDYQGNPQLDGVMVIGATLPGNLPPYGLGKTLVSEVGHWVGLYNAFQGGCTPPGDYVDDTPYESSPAYGCPEGRDTCPAPGTDPIHNYMDYSDDACKTTFTPGQIQRLRQAIRTYRGITT